MGIIRFDPQGSIIPAEVELEGRIRQILLMAVDTGATYLMIPWRVAEALGHDPASARERVGNLRVGEAARSLKSWPPRFRK